MFEYKIWDENDKQMMNVISFDKAKKNVVAISENGIYHSYSNYPVEKIMECSLVKDFKGKDIYRLDLLKTKYQTYLVLYSAAVGSWLGKPIHKSFRYNRNIPLFQIIEELHGIIIGNALECKEYSDVI